MRRLLAPAALLAIAGPALAQAPRIVEDMAGTWQALPVGGGTACTIGLTVKKAGADSWVAKPAPQCATNVPSLATVTSWRPMDGVQLLDGKGKVRVAFVEDETTLLSSPSVADPTLYLIPATTGLTHVPQLGELVGSWAIARGGASCVIQFRATMWGRTTTRLATPASGCAVATAKLDHWWLEGLTLLVGGPDDLLVRFRPVADGRFKGESSARNGATVGGWSLIRTVRAGGPAPSSIKVKRP